MIQVQELRKIYYQGFWRRQEMALDGVSFDVQPGDLFGFIGPNGAGKSTSIKIVLGLLRKSSGQVSLMGLAPENPLSRAQVGFLPEQPYFYDYLTGYELLKLYGGLYGLSGQELERRMDEAAERVGAKPDWLKRRLRTYSKGMLQRVGLAQAIMNRPKLLVLDEPMSGLDPMGRRDVRALLRALHAEGTTIFYSSHVLSDVESICTKVAMIVRGQIRRMGSVREVVGGEDRIFLIRLTGEGVSDALKQAGWEAAEDGRIRCETTEERDRLLRWALESGLAVESVEPARPSLEDVLAEEIAKPHA